MTGNDSLKKYYWVLFIITIIIFTQSILNNKYSNTQLGRTDQVGPTINDPTLNVEQVVTGLSNPPQWHF